MKYNYKYDLPPIKVKFKVEQDGKEIAVPQCDFIVRFYVDGYEGRHYDCTHIGEEYSNCEPTEDGSMLICYLNNHRLGIGELGAEFHYIRTDEHYSDGNQHTVAVIDNSELGIELVEGNGDTDVESAVEVTLPFIYRDAYDIAKRHGYDGDADTFYTALASIVDIANAEEQRVAAENERRNAESERESTFESMQDEFTGMMYSATDATNKANEAATRANNAATNAEQVTSNFQTFERQARADEQNRRNNEAERQSNEDTRMQNEIARNTKEAERILAEQHREEVFAQQTLDLQNKADKSEVNALRTTVINNDAKQQQLVIETANGLMTEIDKKANKSELTSYAKKTDLNSYAKKNDSSQTITANTTNAVTMKAEEVWLGDNEDVLTTENGILTLNGEPIKGGGGGGDAYTKAESDAKFAKLDNTSQTISAAQILLGEDKYDMWTDDDGYLWVNGEKYVSEGNEATHLVAEKVTAPQVNTDAVWFSENEDVLDVQGGKLKLNGESVSEEEVYIGDGTPPTEAKIAIDPSEDLVEIVQEVGNATDKVMSQDAVTKALASAGGDGNFELLAHVVSDSTKGKLVELIPSCKGYKEIIIRREAPTAISQNVYVDMGVYPNSVHFALSVLQSTRRFIWHIKLDPTITITEQYKYNYADTLRCDTGVGVCTAFDITNFDLPLYVNFYNTTAQPDGEDYYVYGKK